MTTTTTTAETESFTESIEQAAERIGAVWPIHSFVTANPLAGFEDRPFHEAVAEANDLFGGRGYPHPSVFRHAWEEGRIDPDILDNELSAHGIDEDPDTLLAEMADREAQRTAQTDDATADVDRLVTKWLSAFLDHGEATWSMPNREDGFYAAWRQLAPYDGELPQCSAPSDLPATATEALETIATAHPADRWEAICEHHLAALPGWTGFIKQRAGDEHDPWQQTYPITLETYLAVRLTIADLLDAPIDPADRDAESATEDTSNDGTPPVAELWLTAWERSYRESLLGVIDGSTVDGDTDATRPAAQLVFCIDTRSEIIRRHIESQGNYETHGYAGFFGIPMQHDGHGSEAASKACPPIVDPQHHITDRPVNPDDQETHSLWTGSAGAVRNHFETLKTNAVAAFTFVEGAGSAYGSALAARTLFPSKVANLAGAIGDRVPRSDDFCEADLSGECDHDHGEEQHNHTLQQGMTHDQQVEYAATAFTLMGWTEFARLVVFTGHAAHTTNNPFDSSLDCGACAGSAGGPNARVLAQICNQEAVKADLRERGFDIPDDTIFLAGEHNTTTDEITLFDGPVPESHADDLTALTDDLEAARETAAAERAATMPAADEDDAIEETARRAYDWAETRPEWGLAGNAAFVIGPRALTADADLDGRAFLHSYDWSTDPDGDALEGILAGPLVVTQWINNQYYFATVDNAVYGSGSKVTQNPLGNVGVVQGNGGDLMSGLPLQSLMATDDDPYHQPLRLSAVVHAPIDRVTDILADHDEVTELLDNGWLSLTVVDPQQDNRTLQYDGELEWTSVSEPQTAERLPSQTAPSVADD